MMILTCNNDDVQHYVTIAIFALWNLPPVKLDIYSHRDRWISINSPYSMKYTREDSSTKASNASNRNKLAYNMTKEGGGGVQTFKYI